MNEQESKIALFQINYEYMTHSPRKRKKMYKDYVEKRNEVKKKLSNYVKEKSQERCV